jgi:Mor family transcriptional regulator
MKSRLEPKETDLFNEGPMDRAFDLIALIKKDIKDMKAVLKTRQVSLNDIHTILHEVQDGFYQARQGDLYQEIDMDSDDDFEQLKSILGNEKAVRVVEFFAGSTIYIPKLAQTMENYRRIRQEYKDGANYRELSVKYGYTETHIRRIIHTGMNKNGKA